MSPSAANVASIIGCDLRWLSLPPRPSDGAAGGSPQLYGLLGTRGRGERCVDGRIPLLSGLFLTCSNSPKFVEVEQNRDGFLPRHSRQASLTVDALVGWTRMWSYVTMGGDGVLWLGWSIFGMWLN